MVVCICGYMAHDEPPPLSPSCIVLIRASNHLCAEVVTGSLFFREKLNMDQTPLSPTGTVVIDYDTGRDQFYTTQEHLTFSAEKLMSRINWRAAGMRVEQSSVGHLLIVVGSVRCKITKKAVEQLALLYRQNTEYHHAFSWCHPFFAGEGSI